MNTTKRNYEALYIVDSNTTDEQLETIISKYTTLVANQGGEVQAAGKWDKRRLAYEVKGRREGIYILMYFSGEPAVQSELDRVFKISDEVFRHIILQIEPEHVGSFKIEQPTPTPESEILSAPVPAPEAPAAEAAPAEEAPAAEAAPAEEAAEAPATEEA